MPRKLLIATTNAGKAREISKILEGLPVDTTSLAEFPSMPEASEDFETFEENAMEKARHYGKLSGLATVAEDAGLEIPALDNWPGVRSARIASTDKDRVAMVLDRMKDKVGEDRDARFVSVAAFYDPETDFVKVFIGICQGRLTEEPHGENGFGYDPIFQHPGFGKTMAELSTDEKNLVSHRGQSFGALRRFLTTLSPSP